ncbi:MAG: hypothetical protein NTU49_06540, partial [Gammaproteobacteria bacterium]|nr:hypothetical protein [Gammaproteobacteria bacterium]
RLLRSKKKIWLSYRMLKSKWHLDADSVTLGLFAGIGKQITKKTFLDFGYLNQEQFGANNQINNVIFLSFTVML